MQIIDDTEVFEPSECLFAVVNNIEDPDRPMIVITDKHYWEEEHYLNDCFGEHSLSKEVVEKLRANDIRQDMEAIWSSEKSQEEVRQFMISLGFVESKEMADFLSKNNNDV